jgi:hypothetical protein
MKNTDKIVLSLTLIKTYEATTIKKNNQKKKKKQQKNKPRFDA